MIRKSILILAVVLLAAAPALAANESGWQYKPFSRNFDLLKADPRQPTMAAEYFSEDGRGNAGFMGKFGAFLAPIRYHDAKRNWTWQATIEGGVFALFESSSGGSLQSRANDFLIGLNLSWTNGPVQAQMRFMHLSSHPGDWHIRNENPATEIISWEAVNGRALWKPMKWLKVYGGGTWFVTHSDEVGNVAYQAGFELTSPRICSWADAYLAADFQGREINDYTPGSSLQAGFNLGRTTDSLNVRVYAFYYAGHSPMNVFLTEWVNRIGVGLSVDW